AYLLERLSRGHLDRSPARDAYVTRRVCRRGLNADLAQRRASQLVGLPSRRRAPLYEVSSSKHGGVEGLRQVGKNGLSTSRQRLTRSGGGWCPFEKARSIVHKLRITSKEAWETYCRSGKKPADISSAGVQPSVGQLVRLAERMRTSNFMSAHAAKDVLWTHG